MSLSGSHRFAGAALALSAALALMGASGAAAPRVAPSPTPVPLPTRAATPVPAFAPAVLVYPFDVSGELKPNAGAAIAQIFDQQLAVAGGLSVLPSPPNVKRKDYLTNARALKADYYISGYLTPVGDGAALVTQVVSVQSGIMILTRTAQVYTAQDASSQAFLAREMIFQHSGVAAAAAAQDAPSSTPVPTASQGASVSLGGLGSLFNIFHRKAGAKDDAGAAVAEAAKPSRVAIAARIEGSGPVAEADAALRPALDRYFKTRVAAGAVEEGRGASAICGTDRNATVVSGTVAQSRSGGFRPRVTNTFSLVVYTCFGAALYRGEPVSNGSLNAAVNAAVAAYAKAHPDNS